jgi:RNA polymerase sigma-70 factor, ECF subfamily
MTVASSEQVKSAQPFAQPSVHHQMLAAVPRLRAFAISLTGNVDAADDLVQEALTRGLSNLDRFQVGTNMQAWMFTILRNLFHSEYRRRKREVEDVDGAHAERVAVLPDQMSHLEFEDMRIALTKLPVEQREALLLVGAEGLSYEEAARICGTHLGTIKSRINRARTRLAELLSIEAGEDIGPDRLVRAVLDARSF